MPEQLVHTLRVRYAECDPQGIVFNSRYLEYFDVALTELWREVFGDYEKTMLELDVDLVVAEANVRYHRSLRFDDVFRMVAGLKQLGRTSMTTTIAIEHGDDLVAGGEMRHVYVQRGTANKTEIPERIRGALGRYLVDPDP